MKLSELKKLITLAAMLAKTHAHGLRGLGSLFFILAFLMGLLWIAGNEVEPIAYVFGLISSFFFACPSIAELIAPCRKPIRYMNYGELLSFVETTDAYSDWSCVRTNWAEEAFSKEDPRLRIRTRSDNEGLHIKGFDEPWAKKFPDPVAHSYWYELTYDGALIDRFIMVSVDGARAKLPLPNRNTLEVPLIAYRVAQIFDQINTLDKYMERAALRVGDVA
jgi:hypothetical protein